MAFPFYIGKGRLEIVNDAWNAVQILRILDDRKIIKRDITEKDIVGLANKIAEVKNLRNTDDRLEGIAEYEQLVKYMLYKKMVRTDDHRFFAYLLDAYRFENFAIRFSGKTVKFGLVPRFAVTSEINNLDSSNDFTSSPSISLAVEMGNYIPKNLLWQYNRDHRFDVRYSWNKIVQQGFNGSSLIYEAVFFFDYLSLGWRSNWEMVYLPNRRTKFSLRYDMGYRLILFLE